MVARKTAKERAKLRRLNERKIRRSPILSLGAKTLWVELSDWAWDDPTCFPKQELLVLALKKERTTISRWLTELKKHKLVLVRRLRHGNQYTLAEEVPPEVCDPARGINSELVKMLRASRDVADLPHQDAESGSVMSQKRTRDVAEMPHDIGGHVAEMPHPNVADLQHASEVHQREEEQEEEEVQQGKMDSARNEPNPGKSDSESDDVSARCARDTEGGADADNEEQGTYVAERPQPEDPSELMADPEVQVPRKRRKKRGSDPALMGKTLPGKGLRDAGSPSAGQKVVGASSPPPLEPEDVLAHLRSEIESKYGKKACKGLPFRVDGVQGKQIKNCLLNVFAPDVVVSIIRVLVWDWETARATIFPYHLELQYPNLKALIQYRESLAPAVTTGLRSDGGRRGAWNSYRAKYLQDQGPSEEKDPF